MEGARIQGFGRVFQGTANSLIAIMLMAVICIMGCMYVSGCAEAKGQTGSSNAGAVEATGSTDVSLDEVEQKQPAQKKAETSAEEGRKWQTVQMRVTAYCPCSKCCGEYADGQTACGHRIRAGDAFVAADARYAFGTEMIIAGYGNDQPVRVLDRGGAIRGDRLDVFFHTHEEALEWGVQYLDVKVYVQ
ncbi:MAG: 3D domain-containing protein [Planctomycetota bacterium]